MHDHDVTVNQMQWQPALLRLTSAPHPEIDDGAATLPCFVAPQWIIGIERRVFQYSKTFELDQKWPLQTATCVTISSSQTYWVSESPEQVAMMRDRALGHEPKLEKVS